MEEALSRHEASKVSRSQPAPCHFVASTRRCHVRIETGRQKDGMLKDIDYRIGQEVQSARLVVPNFLSGGSVTFFISKTAHQAVHARMG